MGDEKDKLDNSQAAKQDVPAEESKPQGFEDELFTSAEYNFRHLTDPSEPSPRETKESSEAPPVVAQRSSNLDTSIAPSDDPAWTEADTSAPPAILPPVHEAARTAVDMIGEGAEAVPVSSMATASDEESDIGLVSTDETPKAALPGKDTQSVVVDMGQLNEDAEREAQERAARRAAFAPLESSGAMERITFSNLAALNFPTDDGAEDSEDGSTVNLHRSDFEKPRHTEPDAAFDVENQTFGADDHVDQKLGRPGRWLFFILVAVVLCVVTTVSYAVWNLGEHRMHLTKKPIEAIEMGLGLRPFPKPVEVPPLPPPQVNKITGRLEIQNVQLDWAKDKQSVVVSGRLKNGSNVDHERIELTVQLFDELQKTLIVKKIDCCRLEQPKTSKGKKEQTDASTRAPDDSTPLPFHVVKSGTEKRFSAPIMLKKPRRGEVSVKASVSYSEVID